MTEVSESSKKKICDICEQVAGETNELFGPWMVKNGINVHYFCLILSTNLPQNGKDFSGICGFLLRDIRTEINSAKQRLCCFCDQRGASIACKVCKVYFHLKCGLRNLCLFQYTGEFNSYCDDCYTLSDIQKQAKSKWMDQECFICMENLGRIYNPTDYLYAACCGNGFIHRSCMQKYASSAGYYLKCIWCRATSFRESICLQGIFVPDREAHWETRDAFRDLHRAYKKCDVDFCRNPNGREHNKKPWKLISCCLCGSFGVHYPKCLPESPTGTICTETDFKCSTCAFTELKVNKTLASISIVDAPDAIDTSFYVPKKYKIEDLDMQICFSQLQLENSNLSEANEKGVTEDQITTTTAVTEPTFSNTTLESENLVYKEPDSSIISRNRPHCNKNNNVRINNSEEATDNNASSSATDFQVFDCYEFSKDYSKVGTVKYRLDMNSERFKGKTIQEILSNPKLLRNSDVMERSDDMGIFKAINEFLDEEIKIYK